MLIPTKVAERLNTFVLIIALAMCVGAQARLNETLEQCETRYGPATSKDAAKAEVTFEKTGIRITAHFHQGKVDAIMFGNANGEVFTTAEINVLAESNLGKEWKTANPVDAEKNESALYSSEQSLRGYVRAGRRELMFFTLAHMERTVGDKAKQGDAGRRLNGF